MSYEPVEDAVAGIAQLVERGCLINLCPHPIRVAVGYYCWVGNPEDIYLEPGTTWRQVQTNALKVANEKGSPMQWVDIPPAEKPFRLQEVDEPEPWTELVLGEVLLEWMQEAPMALVAGLVTRRFDVSKDSGVADLIPVKEGVTYIVSLPALMGLQAAGVARDDLIAPDTGETAIRDEKGQIKAVRGFVRLG